MTPILIAAVAFLDAGGKHLLSVGTLDSPAQFTHAVCGDKTVAIRHVKSQPRGPKDTGRRTARNFEQSQGELFDVVGSAAPSDDSCLIGTDAFFAGRKVVPVRRDGKSACGAGCVVLGTFGKSHVTLIVEPHRAADVVAYLDVDGAKRAFSAKWDPQQMTCWRVDDGCKLEPEALRVPFALTGAKGTELFFLWNGAEGQNVELLRAHGDVLELELTASRYWSPE